MIFFSLLTYLQIWIFSGWAFLLFPKTFLIFPDLFPLFPKSVPDISGNAPLGPSLWTPYFENPFSGFFCRPAYFGQFFFQELPHFPGSLSGFASRRWMGPHILLPLFLAIRWDRIRTFCPLRRSALPSADSTPEEKRFFRRIHSRLGSMRD